ncbi:hypothetical protein D3C85_1288530 [compost metagenome]
MSVELFPCAVLGRHQQQHRAATLGQRLHLGGLEEGIRHGQRQAGRGNGFRGGHRLGRIGLGHGLARLAHRLVRLGDRRRRAAVGIDGTAAQQQGAQHEQVTRLHLVLSARITVVAEPLPRYRSMLEKNPPRVDA